MRQRGFILLLYCTLAQACPGAIPISVAFSSKTCDFIYQQINGNCNFIKCSYQQSTRSQVQAHGWSQCFSECCSDLSLADNDDTIGLLYSCQDANNRRSVLMKILLITLLGAAFILVVVFVVCLNKKTCPIYKLLKGKQGENYAQNPKHKISRLEHLANAIINRTDAQLDLQYKEPTLVDLFPGQSRKLNELKVVTKNMKILQSKCGICLDIKPFCELNCGHIFHDKCLGEWFEYNSNFGPCGQGNIKIVRVYCCNCYAEIGIYSIHRFKSKNRKGHAFTCQNCRSAQKGM